MYLQKVISRTTFKKISFLLASWRSVRSVTKIAGSGDPNPDPLVRGMDPRIRIHTKMSWIRNTSSRGSNSATSGSLSLWTARGRSATPAPSTSALRPGHPWRWGETCLQLKQAVSWEHDFLRLTKCCVMYACYLFWNFYCFTYPGGLATLGRG